MRCRNCGRKNYLALWCTPCQKEYAKETRAATVREIAKALAQFEGDAPGELFEQAMVFGNAKKVESALWTLLGKEKGEGK